MRDQIYTPNTGNEDKHYNTGTPAGFFSEEDVSKLVKINLGKHEHHDWQPILGDFGPHKGKIICNTCKGKWVTWLPRVLVEYLHK
jgi:hypothetical protein